MITRAEIKANARENFKANYWPIVGITVLFGLIIVGLSFTGVGMFVAPAITVGYYFFCMAVYFGDKQNQTIEQMFNVGFAKFGRNLGALLLEGLLVYAWSLLFVIPGIIKAYAYSMTTFILADCPDVKAVDAITISRRMMKGHKWQYFVLQLSFIGWQILSMFTMGLLTIFYVGPYYYAAEAGFYAELKKKCIEDGVVTAEQFAGAPLDGSAAPVYAAEDTTVYASEDVYAPVETSVYAPEDTAPYAPTEEASIQTTADEATDAQPDYSKYAGPMNEE